MPERWQRARLVDPGIRGPLECWVRIEAPWFGTGFSLDGREPIANAPSYVTHFIAPDGGSINICADDVELLPIFADEVEPELMPNLVRWRPRRGRRRRGSVVH